MILADEVKQAEGMKGEELLQIMRGCVEFEMGYMEFERDNSSGVPAWLKVLCNAEFFEPCKTHLEAKKNDLNFFCIDCHCSMCSHCLQHHLEHQYIQIRRYMYQHVINVQDLRKLFRCSGIQTFQTNRAKVVLLEKRPSSQQQSGTTSYRCVSCERTLQDAALYCSIRCKVAEIYGDKTPVMVDENGEGEETTKDEEKRDTISPSEKKEKRPNSRKRKGSPSRAPQF
ncbi:protein RGF1 INDUCIBLE TRANSCRIPTION FACTOR 1-like [Telopea speciosissima]|uniref:protein RGF1 INDUCIBLE TRANSCRIPTION FACTOR 1-like n=1 Tax=Telopea speciosissima TaxID=54955 RepID=UPI001CC6CCA8|nr:protein RGF1 INDUCIBLE TRANSCRIPTION FACTOR 1-like [Telopea speciosissima]